MAMRERRMMVDHKGIGDSVDWLRGWIPGWEKS